MTSNRLYFAKLMVYELYKIDWLRRITADRKMYVVRGFFEETVAEKNFIGYPIEDYIKENGYQGELYVCFNEFCGAELNDKEYIRELIGSCNPLLEYIEAYWNGYDLGYGKGVKIC